MNTNKALAETLGIQIEEVVEKKTPTKIIKHDDSDPDIKKDQTEDYNLGRRTLRGLISTGIDSLEDMKDLAKQSESPRAYEVMSTMMKTIADMTKDLYDIQKKTKDLNAIDDPKRTKDSDGNITVEKAVFVGSTADLLRKIKEEE
jgi:hypothetical protein